MHDVISKMRFNFDELPRLSQDMLALVTSEGGDANPIRYRAVLNSALRIRTIWASHVALSAELYAFISAREPRLKEWLINFEAEQARLSSELTMMTPPAWPQSTALGLNCLRIRAFQTLPNLMHELEREELTVLPLVRRWIYGGVTTAASIIQRENSGSPHVASA
jgi:hypothetical protein